MTPSGEPWAVQLIRHDEMRARFARWQDEAVGLGIGVEYTLTLAAIFDELSTRPVEFGDPQYHGHHAGFLVYHRLFGLLQVWYAIPAGRRLVWVQDLRPRRGLGFSEE